VARPEVAPAAFLVFLDSHVWVAECYTLDSVAILDVNHRLLFAVARLTFADPARLVQRHLFAFVGCHQSTILGFDLDLRRSLSASIFCAIG